MDIRMPELDGLAAAERILADPQNTTAVVMLTTFDASEYVYEALRIGATGFLLKDTPVRPAARRGARRRRRRGAASRRRSRGA